MSLVSIGFFVFLAISTLALRVTPRAARLWLLALLNLVFFYVGAGIRGLLVLIYVLVVAYVFARLVADDASVEGGCFIASYRAKASLPSARCRARVGAPAGV